MTKFSRLEVNNWRQFSSIDIEVHPRLTVLTGANGAGKSTLMRMFSQHFGFSKPLLGVPVKDRNGVISYFSGVFTRNGKSLFRRILESHHNHQREVGRLFYENGASAALMVPDIAGQQFHISFVDQQSIIGIHIDSHQPISAYQQVTSVPINPITPDAAYNQYSSEIINAYQGTRSNLSPMYRLKEALISLAIFGEGNNEVDGNSELRQFFLDFQKILGIILPQTLGFERLRVQPPEVVLVTRSGDFVIDSVSGGILSLIDFAWRIFCFSKIHPSFVVTIDEPENHLHPSLQRELMPSLIEAFPSAQFIIATHSPFMVSSVKDSNVFALRYSSFRIGEDHVGDIRWSEASRVESVRLDSLRRAATANEILREVLGVPATMPAWAHDELREILTEFEQREISAASVAELRASLEKRGFEELYPEALAKFVGVNIDQT